MPDDATGKKKFAPRSLLGVLSFLRKYPGRVALSVGLLLVNIAIEMTLPQVLGNAITGLRHHLADGVAFSIRPFVLLFLALVSVRAGVGFVLGPIRNRAIQTTLGDIRAALYNALQRLAFTYHDKANSGELISRATTDVWRLQDFLFACLLLSADIGVSLVATTTLILLISPALGAVALATMLPTVALISFYAGKLQPRWRNVHDQHGAMTTVIQENIAGVRVVKAFAREQAEIAKFRGRKDTYLNTLLDTVNFWASRVPRAQFLYGLSMPLALWIGGREVINGTMPIGDLAKVVFYLMAIGHRVGMVGQFTNILQNASASAERVLEIIREPQTVTSGSRPLPPGRGEVRFVDVSFEYPIHAASEPSNPTQGFGLRQPSGALHWLGRFRNRRRTAAVQDAGARSLAPLRARAPEAGASRARPESESPPPRPVLHDIHFTAQPGQTIAIVGPTGSGKTTLVNLIPRFYDPTSGSVRVDGVDVRELDLGQLRRNVGVIFQETFLFSASAAENIAYGRPGAARAEIEQCARAAQAHDFIAELEEGYDTVIGERGVSLSGGQRQRIAIARAFLMDPRILILDDATASVDSQTERLIQEAMQRLCRGRTTFVIAQRLSTVQHADWILLLKDGRLADQGRHPDLQQRSEFYRSLFNPAQVAASLEVGS
jgi:ATP-binding cassette subfamily B protein